jgi:phosphoribosylpyrophosphate synthetase
VDGTLNEIAGRALTDLIPHRDEFDAIVCAGDMHGAPIAGAIASWLNKPLMIVCEERHRCCVSHITTIGECRPEHRYLYVDDWFSHGASLAHTLRVLKRSRRRMFRYLNQSAPANVVATYAAVPREYKETAHEPT